MLPCAFHFALGRQWLLHQQQPASIGAVPASSGGIQNSDWIGPDVDELSLIGREWISLCSLAFQLAQLTKVTLSRLSVNAVAAPFASHPSTGASIEGVESSKKAHRTLRTNGWTWSVLLRIQTSSV